jgi:hypothetical protein
MPFTSPSERVIFPERIGGELLGHEDAPQVGMAIESNTKHVKNLSLHPVGPRPDRHGRGERRIGVVHTAFDDEAFNGVEVLEHLMDFKPAAAPAGVSQVVGRPQL